MDEQKHRLDRIRPIMVGIDKSDPYEVLATISEMVDAAQHDVMAMSMDLRMAWSIWRGKLSDLGRLGLILADITTHYRPEAGSTMATSVVCDSGKQQMYIETSDTTLPRDIIRLREVIEKSPAWEVWGRMWLGLKEEETIATEEETDLWDDLEQGRLDKNEGNCD